ncbi:MAG: hypothetical protein LRY40_01565 [Shewanella fodinae]|nr:hypothetical protein [Shewanella fodinae]
MNKPEEFGVSGKHIYTFPVKMAYWMKGSFEIRVYQQAKGLFALVQHFNTSGDTYVTKGICAGQVETRAAELYVGCLRNGAYFENNGMVPILNNYHFGKQYKIRSFSSTTDKEWQKSKLICEAGISDTFSVTKDPYGALEVESTVEYPVYYVRSELVAWIYNLEGEPSAVCEQASSGGYLLFDISFSETLNANLLKECHCRKAGIGRSLEVLKQNPSKIIRTPGVGLASAKIAQDAPLHLKC